MALLRRPWTFGSIKNGFALKTAAKNEDDRVIGDMGDRPEAEIRVAENSGG